MASVLGCDGPQYANRTRNDCWLSNLGSCVPPQTPPRRRAPRKKSDAQGILVIAFDDRHEDRPARITSMSLQQSRATASQAAAPTVIQS